MHVSACDESGVSAPFALISCSILSELYPFFLLENRNNQEFNLYMVSDCWFLRTNQMTVFAVALWKNKPRQSKKKSLGQWSRQQPESCLATFRTFHGPAFSKQRVGAANLLQKEVHSCFQNLVSFTS